VNHLVGGRQQLFRDGKSDQRYQPLALATDRLWAALLRPKPLEVQRAVKTILAECERLD
jgi:hypothetical protein